LLIAIESINAMVCFVLRLKIKNRFVINITNF